MSGIDQVIDVLGLDAGVRPHLDSLDPAPPPAPLPDVDALPRVLTLLGLDDADIGEMIALRPAMDDAEPRWALDTCCAMLSRSMTSLAPEYLSLPALEHATPVARRSAVARYFYPFVFTATVPAVREFHRGRGIPEQVSWASLADLGQQMRVHRRIFGVGGLHTQNWLTLHFRGGLYSMGRLQFNLMRVRAEHGTAPLRAGEYALGVHIPEIGPLDPAECDASFARAAQFFPRYFPEHRWRHGVCSSWLLDPQLREHLPASSNIVAFGRRFTLLPASHAADSSIVEFVFRKLGVPLDQLHPATSLQRGVVDHLRSGGHWNMVTGWLDVATGRAATA